MAKIHVAFLFNLVQPITQSLRIIDDITRECYQPLCELFNSDLEPRFTISIPYSLIHLLKQRGKWEDFQGKPQLKTLLTQAIAKQKIEIVHTGAFYPIFPLINEREVRRQLDLDIEHKKQEFGASSLSGVLSPELCYRDALLDVFKDYGFSWTLVDDELMTSQNIPVPRTYIYRVNQFPVLMRSRLWSDRLTGPKQDKDGSCWTGSEFVDAMNSEAEALDEDCYTIIALAGETFGHHVKYYEETFLRDMLYALKREDCNVELCRMSELMEEKKFSMIDLMADKGNGFALPSCSWATNEGDYHRGDYFPHWFSRKNMVHKQLWKLTDLLLHGCKDVDFSNPDIREDPEWNSLRILLDRAFYSETYFFASCWFWDPRLVRRGANTQMRVLYKLVELTKDRALLSKAVKIFAALMAAIEQQQDEIKLGGNPCGPEKL